MTRAEFETQLISEARSWVGVAFLLNGRTRSQGVDCLGLLLNVYMALGFEAPPDGARTQRATRLLYTLDDVCTAAMSDHVVEIRPEDRRPGDLLFFKPGLLYRGGPDLIGHTGLALGGNKFVHATRGNGVQEGDLTARAWQKSLAGAARLKAVIDQVDGGQVV